MRPFVICFLAFGFLFQIGCSDENKTYKVVYHVEGTGVLGSVDFIQYSDSGGNYLRVGKGTTLPWSKYEKFECGKAVRLVAVCEDGGSCTITDYYVTIDGKKYDGAKPETETLSGGLSTPNCW